MAVLFSSRAGSTSARGFQMRYSSNEPALCGGEISSAPGWLASPQYPQPWGSPSECRWYLSLPSAANATALVTFNAFSLPSYDECFGSQISVTPDELRMTTEVVCGNTTIPAPLHIPFTDFRLVYQSLGEPRTSFFNLTYSVKPCGGLVRGPGAQIFSPGYPANYPDNMDCAWLLEFEQQQTVRVRFSWYELGPGDYISVLNGPGSTSPLLAHLSGSPADGAAPTVLHGQSSRVLVVFHSDGSGQHRGFLAETESGCGGVFHTPSGAVESPGFPSDYPASSECEWEIRGPPGHRIQLSFVHTFDLETSDQCQNDYVQVWEKVSEEFLEVGRFCGKNVPPVITSTRDVLKIRFTSDGNDNNGNGFKARWVAVCGGDFTDDSRTFSSPGYPVGYPVNLNCQYRILAKPNDYVTLRFVDQFFIEDHDQCAFDSLAVFESNSTDGTAQLTTCGDRRPQALSVRGPVTLRFKTDFSVGGAGWQAEYTISPCGGNITEPGVIQSPNHPMEYHHSANCTWLVTAPAGKVVLVRFVYLNLEMGSGCSYDSVTIFDDRWVNPDKQLNKFCGDMNSNPPHAVTTSNRAVIRFVSDSSVTREGFKAAVLFSVGPNAGCGGELTVSGSSSVTLRSPDTDSDGSYQDNLDCRWLVRGDEGRVLRFTVRQPFNVEVNGSSSASCPYDYLEVRDGPSPVSPLVDRYCGSQLPPPITASSNQLYVRFYSDSEIHRSGFTAAVTNVDSVCGRTSLTATETTQTLQTPGHPANYPANLRCVWTIAASRYQAVALHFSALQIAGGSTCNRDKLTVQQLRSRYGDRRYRPDGTYWHSEERLDSTYCGTTVPATVLSVDGGVRLQFSSDSDTQMAGFRLEYSLAPCNRTYTAPYGQLMSAWENPGTGSKTCHLLVTGPEGTVITLYLYSVRTQYNSNAGSNCELLRVQLLDGSSSSSPQLGQTCEFSYQGISVVSTGNHLLLRVQASQSYGVFASYFVSEIGARCGGTYHGMVTRLTSPGYPGNYSRDSSCEWTVSVPDPYKLGLYFPDGVDFGSTLGGCNTTYLSIYSVSSSGSRSLITTYCGQTGRLANTISPTNAVVLQYRTDAGTIGMGWRLRVRAVEYEPQVDTLHVRDQLT